MPTAEPGSVTTTDLSGAPEAARLGGFLPDIGTIERLANAFFKGVNGGGPLAPPEVPASLPAPWAPPSAPPAGVMGQAIPAQPPFGFPDPPATSAPASAPLHSFGGASAGSATPGAPLASRALLPAASQTLVSPPQYGAGASGVTAPLDFVGKSPFATELDLRAVVAALSPGLPSRGAPAYGVPYGRRGPKPSRARI